MRRHYFVYIMASRYRGTLYVGVSSDLPRRVREHRDEAAECFTKRYAVTMLVYYEAYEDPTTAIHREKLIKRWRRAWKFKVIEEQNKDWNDRYGNLLNELPLA
jgi:putative endonuclease